jgi:acetyl-CoA carboxylase carboxyltransferase component
MANQAVKSPPGALDPNVKTALDHVRTAAQELHGAISDAMTKRGGATKADLQSFGQKIKTVTDSAKNTLSTQNATAKKKMNDAVTKLESTQQRINDGLKASGDKVQTSVRQALADARASVQKISEAVAAQRSAASGKTSK